MSKLSYKVSYYALYAMFAIILIVLGPVSYTHLTLPTT